MTRLCPNCSKEFTESRETAFLCEDCGWFKNVDGKWYPCPEPAKVTEPDLPKVPIAPAEPVLVEDDDICSYLGGLITVTTIEEDDNEDVD